MYSRYSLFLNCSAISITALVQLRDQRNSEELRAAVRIPSVRTGNEEEKERKQKRLIPKVKRANTLLCSLLLMRQDQ